MNNTSAIEGLKVAGLSEREARIWHALSIQGPLHISQIARETRLHRPAIYDTLPSLVEKKLVKQVQGIKRISYRTTGTHALEKWRASRDKAFALQLKKVKKYDLQDDVSDDVRVYHGKEMLKVWEDVLASTPKATTFFRYDGYTPSVSAQRYMPVGYYERIEHKRIDRFVITNSALRKSTYKKRLECASRMLPASFDPFEQGVSQFIFGNKIALIDFTTETAFVIKNAALAKYQAQVFQYLYRGLPE